MDNIAASQVLNEFAVVFASAAPRHRASREQAGTSLSHSSEDRDADRWRTCVRYQITALCNQTWTLITRAFPAPAVLLLLLSSCTSAFRRHFFYGLAIRDASTPTIKDCLHRLWLHSVPEIVAENSRLLVHPRSIHIMCCRLHPRGERDP